MGAGESKLSVASTPKLEPRAERVARLSDPRSPSCAVDRTPIQVGVAYSPLPVAESVGPVFDPRSPTPGITRTPVKVSVASLAQRLSTFFLNDVKSGSDSVPPLPPVSFTKHPGLPNVNLQNEAVPRDPLLPLVKAQNSSTLNGHADAVSTPSEGYGSICSSPFVLIGDAQMEVEVDAEASLEEAEEALLLCASPLRKELSLSLLACREGVYSSSLEERPLTPLPPAERQANEDHSYALFSVPPRSTEHETSTPVVEAIVTSEADEVPSQTSEEQVTSALPESSHEQQEESKPPTPQSVVSSSKSSPVETVQSGIRCLKFDTRSPSQAIFKPQWLGVGFGSTGVRARGVQARGKTSVSSPLSTKNTATNENNNMVVRTKQRPREKVLVGEGRSPLQILREANSPRDRNSQMKLKVSTPEKQRFSQMDRRALILSLNKENE
ncbi:cell division cycle-associated protein 3 [Sinocyclocheilus rhinocerous]|uniref:Cell division cycle-associated protein 3-like n=1 Tax=Sinocyclocheilus rhinocerous TaxID=307959 RepID=A0A673HFJ4_9TELE|nr:PREDICTED: cell division cycle-associated protein 3-like [Sinocyclocheilus rhinocerous]XP_016389108.1 PREDICTED: cell division cycle-associated protein 3-like [Sinocyclocheilus rhinocerous]XP_016389116.1 PREDICTED: cell division cycle-associated protein 3-like [Sinocyclocheilus rhinocerous]